MHCRWRCVQAPAVLALLSVASGPAMALDEARGEKAVLQACQKDLCHLVTSKAPRKGQFTCSLTKTWRKKDLKEGASVGKTSWFFGDAQCEVKLTLSRSAIISAVKDGKSTLQFPEHIVNCVIDSKKEASKVTAILAPKTEFEGGQAKRIWINLKKFKGPVLMQGLAYTAAGMEDKVGLFRKKLVGAVNKLIHEQCPKVAAGK